MASRVNTQPLFENCRIIFKNFKGEQSQYNRAGDRNFCVVIEDLDEAEAMKQDGWNVKYLPPMDEGGQETAYLPVAVSFKYNPPTIVMYSSKGRTPLDEESIGVLDYMQFENVDLLVNPYNWEVNGKTGVKAYVKSMYVTVQEDVLAKKYASIDMSDPMDEAPF